MRPRGSTGAAPEEAIARPSSSQSNARYTNSRQPAPQHVDRVLSQRSSPVPSTNSLEDLASRPFQSSSPFYNPSSQSHAEQLSPVTPITGRVRKSTIHPGNRPAETSRHVGPGNATYSFSESRPPHSSGRTRLEHTNVSLSREMEDSGKLYGQFLRRGSQLSQAASIDADEPDDSGLGYNSSDADSERSSGKVGGDLLASGEGMLVPHGSTLRVKKKRTRTLPTSHQSAELNKLLSETPFPSTARREELGRRIGLSARKVQVWFQNRRQKARRAKNEGPSSQAPSVPERDEEEIHDRPEDRGKRPSSAPYLHTSRSFDFPTGSQTPRPYDEEDLRTHSLANVQISQYTSGSRVEGSYDITPPTYSHSSMVHSRPTTSKSAESGAPGWTSLVGSHDLRPFEVPYTGGWSSSVHPESHSRRESVFGPIDDTHWSQNPNIGSSRGSHALDPGPSFTEEELKLPPIILPGSPGPSADDIQRPASPSSTRGAGQIIPPPFTLQPHPIWDHPILPTTIPPTPVPRNSSHLSSPTQGPSRSVSMHGDAWHQTRSWGHWDPSDWRRSNH